MLLQTKPTDVNTTFPTKEDAKNTTLDILPLFIARDWVIYSFHANLFALAHAEDALASIPAEEV